MLLLPSSRYQILVTSSFRQFPTLGSLLPSGIFRLLEGLYNRQLPTSGSSHPLESPECLQAMVFGSVGVPALLFLLSKTCWSQELSVFSTSRKDLFSKSRPSAALSLIGLGRGRGNSASIKH
ncbi:hypothetical protein J6590_064104 [Homalodisca vitripennis]|nr:hypothetical protein J6590_064104 [Homalodisca vitripennis]